MNIERQNIRNDSNDRKKSEEEQKLERQRQLAFSQEKRSLLERIEKDKKLACLRSLVERWLIPLQTVENIVAWKDLDTTELKAIFDKIDEMEEMQNIEDILPEKLRITKEEYLSALEDAGLREDVLKKLDQSLTYLYFSSDSASPGVVHFFSSLIHAFDKRNKDVTKVQGNIIDIKQDLEER